MKKIFLTILAVLLLVSCTANNTDYEKSTEQNIIETTENVYTTEPDAVGLEENLTLNNEVTVNNNSQKRCFFGERTGTDVTATGLEPLSKVDFLISDSSSFSSKSTETLSHSYGVAVNEEAHAISKNNQKFFNENGFDAICLDTDNDKKFLYLTFDCGYENGYTAAILDVLKDKNVPAAFFCTLPQMKDNHEIIARMINEGHIVGNHSVTHPDFSTLSIDSIVEEIKGFDDYIRENFGYSSMYFRFPQGKYSEKSMSVINELGFKCVFWSLAYADWDLENQKGSAYALETVMSRIHPGAVILLHAVSPDNANALADIIDSAREKGYEFVSLENL